MKKERLLSELDNKLDQLKEKYGFDESIPSHNEYLVGKIQKRMQRLQETMKEGFIEINELLERLDENKKKMDQSTQTNQVLNDRLTALKAKAAQHLS